MAVIVILFVLVLTGLVLTTVEVLLTLRLLRRSDAQTSSETAEQARLREPKRVLASEGENLPAVSILKPISGLEDELEENLVSFANLRGIDHEIILSIADANDPALQVIERVRQCFPAFRFSLVIGGGAKAANPKVERLVAAARRARGRILFISDSNIRVSRDDIATTVAAFRDPMVGCVSNPFLAQGAKTFGATIESLHLISFVLPGCALASALRVPCVVGKSMAISREAYVAIGGFEAFGSVMAEDQAMALAISKAGYKLILSSTTVSNVVVNRSLKGALDRQVRWNKIRYAFSKLAYTSEFLANPLPLSLLLALVCGLIHPDALPSAAAVAGFTLAVRLLQTGLLMQRLHDRSMFPALLLLPVEEFLQFAAQFKPYFSNEVNWRGHRARLGRGTTILIPDTNSGGLRAGSMQTELN